MHCSDGIEDELEAATPDGVVPNEDEDIDRITRVNGLHEPLLGDHSSSGDDLGDVGVPWHLLGPCRMARACRTLGHMGTRTGEVEQHAKGHDPQTMLGGEVSVRLANVLPRPGLLIGDLDVGRQVLVAPVGRDVIPSKTACQ